MCKVLHFRVPLSICIISVALAAAVAMTSITEPYFKYKKWKNSGTYLELSVDSCVRGSRPRGLSSGVACMQDRSKNTGVAEGNLLVPCRASAALQNNTSKRVPLDLWDAQSECHFMMRANIGSYADNDNTRSLDAGEEDSNFSAIPEPSSLSIAGLSVICLISRKRFC